MCRGACAGAVPDCAAGVGGGAGKSAVLMDVATGTILYESNSHERLAPASVTKVMTMLLIMEAVDSGKIALTDMVTASEAAAAKGGSQIYLKAGETMSVSDMLKSIAVSSANDCACAMAEHIAGSESAFVAMMNQRAQELGCKNTHFANTTGLTQSGHYSSAYDLYLITREAIKHEDFMTMVNTKSYEIPPTNKTEEERVLHSTNALISNWRLAGYLYSGAQGIKTGSTDAAGQCLVSSAVRGSRTLISVVLGAEKVEKENGSGYIVESFTETARLFD